MFPTCAPRDIIEAMYGPLYFMGNDILTPKSDSQFNSLTCHLLLIFFLFL